MCGLVLVGSVAGGGVSVLSCVRWRLGGVWGDVLDGSV